MGPQRCCFAGRLASVNRAGKDSLRPRELAGYATFACICGNLAAFRMGVRGTEADFDTAVPRSALRKIAAIGMNVGSGRPRLAETKYCPADIFDAARSGKPLVNSGGAPFG